jgi:hypothetical protein
MYHILSSLYIFVTVYDLFLPFFFWWYYGLNSGLPAEALPLEPCLQLFYVLVILELGSCILLRLAWIMVLPILRFLL